MVNKKIFLVKSLINVAIKFLSVNWDIYGYKGIIIL